ncbi:hypothetical protein CC80DRAFT_595257 [Byssothecium circinans]|uniref:Uncharacterized protein n=1 Tax=Byssothecium circinans TaxID=147558 RepID=A0A6A5TML1_9PLEO|nr:hypothetical protein CC80DRAFT_595257 [Byssothecium circinans]
MSSLSYSDAITKGRALLSLLPSRPKEDPLAPIAASSSTSTPPPSSPSTCDDPSSSPGPEPEPSFDPEALLDSPFTQYTDLAKHGYLEELSLEPFSMTPLWECLRGLGVDWRRDTERGGKNEVVHHVHAEECCISGILYPKTDAYFSQIVNREEGVLIAHLNYTPVYMGLVQNPPVSTYPDLHHWSDVAFLQYIGQNPSYPVKFDYIIRYSVQNAATLSVIEHILSLHGIGELPKWPGIEFGMEMEEGEAIAGTPNGKGVVWMLRQHRRGLGRKRVRRVNFTTHGSHGLGIYEDGPLMLLIDSVVYNLRDGKATCAPMEARLCFTMVTIFRLESEENAEALTMGILEESLSKGCEYVDAVRD